MMVDLNETFKVMVNYNIVHRDIKLQNILIKYIDNEQNNFIVKLTDYGISKQITNSTICKSHVGTGFTMAPEILEGKEKYDNRCDLWSIGVILYQLYFNEFPYKGSTEVALLNNIKSLGQHIFKDKN
jgi:serine/threonine protein kinase